MVAVEPAVDFEGDGAVFARYRGELVRYATALVGPSHAEDVVMTVVARTIRRRRLGEIEKPRSYLMRAVLNEARGLGRRRVTAPLADDMPVAAVPGMAEIFDVLMSLPVRQRAVVYLHYWERATIREIAGAMGIGEGSVKRYLHMARNRLKEVL